MRYSVLAGVIAGVVTTSLDLLLFDAGLGDAVKMGMSNGITWLVVLLGMLWFVRLKHEGSG